MFLLKALTVTAFITTQDIFCMSEDYNGHRHRRKTLHPHTLLSAPGIIRSRGYPAEIHHVVSKDGYILELHRIPYSPYRINRHGSHFSNHTTGDQPNLLINREKKVAYIQHCVLCSSADFVMNDANEALAFMLSNAGYDVWLGNFRGNIYSRKHVTLTPKHPEFWDFSWDKMARYDLPAMLSYVKSTTGVEKVCYVGHSMGTTTFFAMMNYHPHINSWIHVMGALAPVAYMHNKHAPFTALTPVINNIDKTLTKTGQLEFLTPNKRSATFYSGVCSPKSIIRPICKFLIDLVGGPSTRNLDPNYVSVITAHTPAGSSFHVLTHFLQLVKAKRFQAFDYGVERNVREYRSATPPPFRLEAVTAPVGSFWSTADWVADPQDVHQTVRELPNVVLNHQVQSNTFNHLDFLWAESAGHLVYRHVIALFNRYY